MIFGAGVKGWTVVDSQQNATLCAVSVNTAVPAGQRPLVLAVADQGASPPGPVGPPALPGQTDPNRPEDSTELRELMRKMDRRLPLLMTLARHQYQLQIIAEPPVPAREMQASLRWSINAANEAAQEDINLAWFRVPTEALLPSRAKQVYAVSVARARLDAWLAGWRLAGLRPKVVDIRETALRNIAAALERPGEGLALVSADSGGVGMVFVHQGALYLDRYIEQPLAELQAADPAARQRLHERIALQVMRSVDVIARSYPFMPVGRVVVAPSPLALGLQEHLAAQLPLAVLPLNLDQVFDLSRVPELARSPALQARCLVALGASLRSARAAT